MKRDETQDLLRSVDADVAGMFAPTDPESRNALRRSREAGLPEIQVSASEGKLLQLLAGISGARRTLEIGTLGGYSMIHPVRDMPRTVA